MNVERLTRRIEDRRESRERERMREAGYKDHIRAIQEAAEETKMDFWCRECKCDFNADARKMMRHASRWPVAWYVGQCPKGHSAIRHITDKHHDRYYHESVMLKRQRVELADAMLTPDDPRFALVYPQQWRALEAQRDEHGN